MKNIRLARMRVPAGIALLSMACAGTDPASEAHEETGTIVVALQETPEGVTCFAVVAAGARKVRRTFPVEAGYPVSRTIEGLPVGAGIMIQGSAYANPNCEGTPTWVSDTAYADLRPATPTHVALTLRPNGVAMIEADFEPDVYCFECSATVDQSLVQPGDLSAVINDGFRFVGQTYTAGRSGWLYGIVLAVTGQGGEPLHIALRRAMGGIPDASILTEVTLGSDSASRDDFVRFPEPVHQLAGEEFAIVVDYPSAPAPSPETAQGYWTGASGDYGDAYPGGAAVYSVDGQSWSSVTDQTLHFVTVVVDG